jgi:phosphatidylinositol-3-phosphatase
MSRPTSATFVFSLLSFALIFAIGLAAPALAFADEANRNARLELNPENRVFGSGVIGNTRSAQTVSAINSSRKHQPTPTATPTRTATPKATPTPTPTQAAVITSPRTGATVLGTVPISVQVNSPSVIWVNFLVDGKYLASSPPYTFNWNSTTVSNGGHIIEVDAYATGRVLLGRYSINVNVNNAAGSHTPTRTPTSTPTPTLTLSFSNVFVVMEENHSYSEVVGSSSMPYLNSLISKYALATQYYANTHPSLPNYLWITTGSADGISSDICGVTVSNDNIVRELAGAGVSWKSYQESLPSIGYLGCSSGNYAEKHDPFAYFSDVQNNSVQLDKIVPFTEFATDLAGGTLPRFSFITPNLQDDAHDGTLAQADTWLQAHIAPLLAKSMFQTGGSGLLIIVFDEGTDNTNGGGQVAWVAIGPKVKPGYRSTTFYQHQSTLRLILRGLGAKTFPGAAATARDMTEFFQ